MQSTQYDKKTAAVSSYVSLIVTFIDRLQEAQQHSSSSCCRIMCFWRQRNHPHKCFMCACIVFFSTLRIKPKPWISFMRLIHTACIIIKYLILPNVRVKIIFNHHQLVKILWRSVFAPLKVTAHAYLHAFVILVALINYFEEWKTRT